MLDDFPDIMTVREAMQALRCFQKYDLRIN